MRERVRYIRFSDDTTYGFQRSRAEKRTDMEGAFALHDCYSICG